MSQRITREDKSTTSMRANVAVRITDLLHERMCDLQCGVPWTKIFNGGLSFTAVGIAVALWHVPREERFDPRRLDDLFPWGPDPYDVTWAVDELVDEGLLEIVQ